MMIAQHSRRTRKLKFEINVVPYIDVMLVLVVILMVAAPLVPPSMVALPDAGQAQQTPIHYLELTIQKDGSANIMLHGETSKAFTTNKKDVLTELKKMHEKEPDMPLLIAADKSVSYETVIEMLAGAKKLGITRVGLATQ